MSPIEFDEEEIARLLKDEDFYKDLNDVLNKALINSKKSTSCETKLSLADYCKALTRVLDLRAITI